MNRHKQEFIDYILTNQALLLGEFTLKSGRISPYFFNLGCLNGGSQIAQIGQFYARLITERWQQDFDIVFGPAYKGIPLAVSIVDALYRDYQINKRYSSNRKEIKTYADKSVLLGAEIKSGDKIILVDDVLTTGQTKIAAVNLIKSFSDVKIQGLVVALDRLEKDQEGKSAVAEFVNHTGIEVVSIVAINEIINYLDRREIRAKFGIGDDIPLKLEMYLQEYGV